MEYKCPEVTTKLIDLKTKEETTVTTGPFRNHLFNSADDKNHQKCMRCGVSRKGAK